MTANPTIRAGGSRGRGWGEAGLSIVVPLFNEAVGLATLHGRIVAVPDCRCRVVPWSGE